MALPKFEVGEVVLLRSEDYPHLNGEYAVKRMCEPNIKRLCEAGTGVSYKISEHWTYDLGFSVEHLGGVTSFWQERALRKKHQPGETGFHDLMASLVAPKLLTHQPSGAVAP